MSAVEDQIELEATKIITEAMINGGENRRMWTTLDETEFRRSLDRYRKAVEKAAAYRISTSEYVVSGSDLATPESRGARWAAHYINPDNR